ncbi:RNase HI [Hypnocyclicus thermotrophus]|uniref:ribonuclease H n=1 Tax=Hypnocyclicus thermotrophus TaxID=1627895 RepID=A0AA46I5X3_9FUSO|nr:ribonuclease H [Hypnocyclicus thermotrophus]TDT71430.1 RNase HI [Hypnocyclicus thermotrophus]
MEEIIIYTDGACANNQEKENTGGYGAVLMYKGKIKEIFGGYKNTTNNRMELMAVIEALKQLKRKDIPIKVYSDSSYVVNGINIWIHDWIKKGKIKKNYDLWMKLYNLKKGFKKIEFFHVKGHNGDRYNEIADRLAVKGSQMYDLLVDEKNLD